MYIMKLSEELTWRGFVAQHTFNNITDLDDQTRKFYIGVDPSDDSMTIGNLAALMMCQVFIRHGYEPTLLVGGGTGQIGDPKMDKERPVKPIEEIERNATGIAEQFKRIMGSDIRIVNNNDWLNDLGFYQFQREVGQYFSMTQLLDRDFVKARTGEGGSGLSVAEFSYSLIQGYDFLYLYRTYGIDLQLCGVDQMGNCLSGVHLINKAEGARADVWSTPLVLDGNGNKFGKSEGNAIYLSAEKTSPYQFYQFWLNVDDAGVVDYLKIFTLLGRDEIDVLAAEQATDPSTRAAQKTLAYEVTKLVHGENVAGDAKRATEALFGSGELSEAEIAILEQELPVVKNGVTVVAALIEGGLAASSSEANRLIEQNAISVNGAKITADQPLPAGALVKKGKNNFVLVR